MNIFKKFLIGKKHIYNSGFSDEKTTNYYLH